MRAARRTRRVRTKGVEVLSRMRPMKGMERTPPRGRAMSKTWLMSSAAAGERRR